MLSIILHEFNLRSHSHSEIGCSYIATPKFFQVSFFKFFFVQWHEKLYCKQKSLDYV